MQTLGNALNNKDKQKLHDEAENMLRESKSRMEYMRMQILRAQAALESNQGNGDRMLFFYNCLIDQSSVDKTRVKSFPQR